MYIQSRFNKDGIIIDDPKTYVIQQPDELIAFLNDVYSKDIDRESKLYKDNSQKV